jgi:Domain of unknown function (DUF6457)
MVLKARFLTAAAAWHSHGAGDLAGLEGGAHRVSRYGAVVNTLDQWTESACAELGLDPACADVKAVLDLARDAAHSVARPAAPLTTFLLGVAVGRGQSIDQAAARLRALAASWEKGE